MSVGDSPNDLERFRNERDRLERIRCGDQQAFEAAFRELHPQLCDFVDRFVHAQDIAEEIVQELFFVFWMNRQTVQLTSLRGYLFAAARNRALHHLRHQSFRARLTRRLGLVPELAGVAAPRELSDAEIVHEEQRADIRRAIEALPPRSRQAFALRWDEQLSHAEIGQRMGISVKGVEKLLATARRLLRDPLAKHAPPLADFGD